MFFRLSLALSVCLGSMPLHVDSMTALRFGDNARSLCFAPPHDWRDPKFDDSGWPSKNSDGGSCLGAVYRRFHFSFGSDAHPATLTAHVRYLHGMALFFNGHEVARRRLDDLSPSAVATDVHGGESESILLPLNFLQNGDNVLAIEAHPRTALHNAFVDVEVESSQVARVVVGPYLQALSETGVTVVFETDLPTRARIDFGEHLEHHVSDDKLRTQHELVLRPLHARTLCRYRVEISAAHADPIALAEASFRTLPPRGHPLRFVVYGDVRTGHDIHQAMVRAIAEEDPDLLLGTGDLVGRGSDLGDWERFFSIATPLLSRFALFPSAGNHEYAMHGHGLPIYLRFFHAFALPSSADGAYYSFDAAGIHFVALDSNVYSSATQLAWIERDLSTANRHHRPIFVFAHEGPSSSGMHGGNRECMHSYVPLLERHHVALFMSGHDHDYERGRIGGLHYLVSGGGGAELRAPTCGTLGLPACPPSVSSFVNEHHYVSIEVLPTLFRICPKRPDGSALVACVDLPIHPWLSP